MPENSSKLTKTVSRFSAINKNWTRFLGNVKKKLRKGVQKAFAINKKVSLQFLTNS